MSNPIYLNNSVKIEIVSDLYGKRVNATTPENNSIFLLSDGTFTHDFPRNTSYSGVSEMMFSLNIVDNNIVNTFIDRLNKASGTIDTSNAAILCNPFYQSCTGSTYVDPVKVIPPGPTQSVNVSVTQSVPLVNNNGVGIVSQEVSKGEVVGSSDNISNDSKNPDGKFPGISVVDKPTIVVPPIHIDVPGSDQDKKELSTGLGYLPIVWYNGYQIDTRDLRYFALYHDGFIPKIKITFRDTLNIIDSDGFPLDDTKVQIFLNSRSKNLKSIHLEFKIQNFQDDGMGIYTFIGTINLSELYLKKYKSYNNKTSYDVMRDVCGELQMGFNSNIDNTNDKMTWINAGKKVHQFIDDIILNSYKSDASFIVGYIDYYYSFNYVDIEKELGRDVANDLCIDTSGLSEQSGKDDSERITRLGLSSDESFKQSSLYFSKPKIRNDSTSISLRKGYLSKVKYYDQVKKDFLVFDVDSITSEGDKTIILKGSPTDEKYFKDNYSTVWMGKIDPDNSHSNFNYSVVQNRQNLDDLVKISAEVFMPNLNFNLYKFQKIFVSFTNASGTITSPLVKKRLTGDWLIIDISFIFSGGKINQVVKMVKRELGMSDDEVKLTPPPSSKKDPGEINDNPMPPVAGSTAPPAPSEASTPPTSPSSNPNPDLYVKVPYKGQDLWYFHDASKGLAGSYLLTFISDLEKYLKTNVPGFVSMKSFGVTRDLNQLLLGGPNRSTTSKHGVGLAIDTQSNTDVNFKTGEINFKKINNIQESNKIFAANPVYVNAVRTFITTGAYDGKISWGGNFKMALNSLGVCVSEQHHFEIPDKDISSYFESVKSQMAIANLKIPTKQSDLAYVYSNFKNFVA